MSEESWNFDYPKIARDSGFKFQLFSDGILDWRQIGSIEVDRILQYQNVEKLDNIIGHLAEVPLGNLLKSNILESGVAKYFSLSQLAIQYLIFCKRFLDETVTSLRNSMREFHSENVRLQKVEQENSNELLQLHKEMQKLKNISEIVYPCSLCTKNFISNEMLNIHISRKHSLDLQKVEKRFSTEKENDKNLISTIKLELEIKHLKERLNDAEKIIRNRRFNTLEVEDPIDEIKKSSPRSCCSDVRTTGTQNESAFTRDIGIQSNLVEEKEINDVDSLEKDKIMEIFTELKQKIDKIESSKKEELEQSEKSLLIFKDKLQKVTETLEAKQKHDAQLLEKFSSSIALNNSVNQEVNLDELKEHFDKTITKIQSQNFKQFSEAVEKIDTTYSEKLETLKTELDTISKSEINANLVQTDSNIDLTNKQNFVDSIKLLESKKIRKNKLTLERNSKQIRRLNKNVEKLYTHGERNCSTDNSDSETKTESTQSSLSEIDTPMSKKSSDIITKNLVNYTKPEQKTLKLVKELSKTVKKSPRTLKSSSKFLRQHSKSLEEIIVPPLELHSPKNLRKQAIHMSVNRLKTLGISTNVKSLPSTSMNEISALLTENHKSKKKLFPNFYVTRNRIKKLVDNICSAKERNNESTKNFSKSLRKPIAKSTSEEDIITENKTGFVSTPGGKVMLENTKTLEILEESIDSEGSNTELDNKNPETTSNFASNKDVFKMKLEKILSSPIRKINKPQIPDTMPKIPIPAPRKKVMFNFQPKLESEESTFSGSSAEEKNKDKKFTNGQDKLKIRNVYDSSDSLV